MIVLGCNLFVPQQTTFAWMNIVVNKIFSALSVALAVLILVVSCPVKRLLQNNFVYVSTTATKSSQTNLNQRSFADYSTAGNCSLTAHNTVLVKQDLSQQDKLPLPFHPSIISDEAGFDLNYFLTGLNPGSFTSANTLQRSIPLFLQHLRLLIWFFSPSFLFYLLTCEL